MNPVSRARAGRLATWLLAGFALPLAGRAQEPPLTLLDAASAALDADPMLSASVARGHVAEAERRRVGAQRWPSLRLDGTAVRFQEPMVVAPLHSFDPSTPPRFDEALVQGAARVRYTAFDGGKRGADLRAADQSVEGAHAMEEARRMEALERVTSAYLSVLTGRAHAEAARLRVEALEAEEDRARQAVDAGSSPRIELLRASAALQEARAELASVSSRAAVAERTLARLMGLHPTGLADRPMAGVEATDGFAEPPVAPSPHPVVVEAMARERAAEHRLDGERAGRLPQVHLDAALMDYGTWTGDHVAEWQAGVAVSWPLFTGGARGAAIRRAEAELAAARHETAGVRRDLEIQADGARASVTEADARASALAASVSQWAEVARIEGLAMETGAGVQSDLLLAQASLYRARAGWAEARHARVLARVRLARAQGALDVHWLASRLEMVP